jgi:hypothetical protein
LLAIGSNLLAPLLLSPLAQSIAVILGTVIVASVILGTVILIFIQVGRSRIASNKICERSFSFWGFGFHRFD